jgi:hypothetical protein
MEKIDFKKDLGSLYKASAKKTDIITVPKLKYLMVDGCGDPNHSQLFQDAIEALFSVSYTIKFMLKKGTQQVDYGVMPLEGLWYADDMEVFSSAMKADWKWTLMIMQPDFVTDAIVAQAIELAKKKKELPKLRDLRFEAMEEGLCAQVLYIGPYSDEGPAITRLHDFIKENGYKLAGKHREIYLSDMRKTAPEKLKTIIRQPVQQAV